MARNFFHSIVYGTSVQLRHFFPKSSYFKIKIKKEIPKDLCKLSASLTAWLHFFLAFPASDLKRTCFEPESCSSSRQPYEPMFFMAPEGVLVAQQTTSQSMYFSLHVYLPLKMIKNQSNHCCIWHSVLHCHRKNKTANNQTCVQELNLYRTSTMTRLWEK